MYVVYGKENCSFCKKAEALLRDKDVEWVYVDLADEPEDLEWLKGLGCRTVPQIFRIEEEGVILSSDHLIGGFDQLCEHFDHIK